MKIYRRIFGKVVNQMMKKKLEEIFNESVETVYFSKDVDEKSNEYHLIKQYVNSYGFHDSVIGTEFTDEEIFGAEVVCFTGGRPFAYPQPEEPKFLDNTYLNSCYNCGCFGDQKSGFSVY